jgi:periplasmic divalent cation tolerance protein
MPNSQRDRYVVVWITAASPQEAEEIARKLVEEKLVACANVLPPMQSIFWWQGEVCKEKETLITAKTLSSRMDEIIGRAKQLHTYQVPEIIALPFLAGSPDYLDWIDEALGEGAPPPE